MILSKELSLWGQSSQLSGTVGEQLNGLETLETSLQTTFSLHLLLDLTWSCSPIYLHTHGGTGCFTAPTEHLLDHK